MTSDTAGYWRDHYAMVAQEGPAWLDLSNDRVQHQGFTVCLEAAAALRGRVCLDIGCGNGQLARLAHALGAARVIGLDLVEAMIERNRASCPGIDWRVGDIMQQEVATQLPPCDCIFLVEILQYVNIMEVVGRLWPRLAPGGRLVGLVPNAECPLVRRAVTRFGGHYTPAVAATFAALVQSLPGVAAWAVRDLVFADDQRILPYAIGPWTVATTFDPVPNRFNFVLVKAE